MPSNHVLFQFLLPTEEPISHEQFLYLNGQLQFYEHSRIPARHSWLYHSCEAAISLDDALH